MKIALLGLGTVGRAVYDIIAKKQAAIFEKEEIIISHILVRNKAKYFNVPSYLLTTNYDDIINDSSVDVVIEMMGASVSYEYMKIALEAKKHVITANKEVIANHYVELQELAIKNDVKLFFEASVGGGIPIVHTLLNSSPFNNITSIKGILNGTTNFILTSMQNEHLTFEEALKLAQDKGFAEADPTADLEGLDMVRKIAILSMICYQTPIDINKIYHYGISRITREIVEIADLLGYHIKFISSSYKMESGISIMVEPVFLKTSELLSTVDYEYNMVEYSGDNCATQVMYGKGAGPITANSIIFDLGLLISKYNQNFMPTKKMQVIGNEGIKSRYFIQSNSNIDNYFIEKDFKKFIISRALSKDEFESLLPSIQFYARIID